MCIRDSVLGFVSTGAGSATNLAVNLGKQADLTALSDGALHQITKLSATDLNSIYTNWSTSGEVSFGIGGYINSGVGTASKNSVWVSRVSTEGMQSAGYTAGSFSNMAPFGVKFVPVGSLLNTTPATNNSLSSAALSAVHGQSWSSMVGAGAFDFPGASTSQMMNPIVFGTNKYVVSDLFVMTSGSATTAKTTYLGTFGPVSYTHLTLPTSDLV